MPHPCGYFFCLVSDPVSLFKNNDIIFKSNFIKLALELLRRDQDLHKTSV